MSLVTFAPTEAMQVTLRPRIYKVDIGKVGFQGPQGPPGDVSLSNDNDWTGDQFFGSGYPWVDIRAFGAVGNRTTDDSDAIEDAIDFAARINGATPIVNGGYQIYWPPGEYRITRPVFSYTPTGALYGPMHHFGAGHATTKVLLDPPSGADTWMYDSSPDEVINRYQLQTFSDMSFGSQGTNAEFANGFRYYSTGHEKRFSWHRCSIAVNDDALGASAPLKVWLYACGTGNADQTVHFNCVFGDVTEAILKINNLQAIDHDFFGCKAVNIRGDLFKILGATDDATMGLGGGGEINWIGGTIAQHNDDQGYDRYLLDVVGSSNLSTIVRIRPNQLEMSNTEGRIVRKAGANGILGLTIEQAKFDSISSDGTDYTVCEIAQGTTVVFRDCIIRNNMVFDIIQAAAGGGYQLSQPGKVLWENCTIPQDLSKRCKYDGVAPLAAVSQAGEYSAQNCQFPVGTASALNTTYGTYYAAADFDLGWRYGTHGVASKVKMAGMHHDSQLWPRTSGQEAGVVLPYYSVIVGFVIYKPAGGADTGAHQYAVGTNDRVTTYASSALAQWKDAHIINVDLPPNLWVPIVADENKRKVELWASTASGTGDQSPGNSIAMVKYL